MDDLISRQAAIDAVVRHLQLDYEYAWGVREAINALPSAQPTQTNKSNALKSLDCISRQAAIEDVKSWVAVDGREKHLQKDVIEWLKEFPSAQPKKEIAKRVLWTGWKGYRNTRYKCPNCKKPVKNDDIYCHRCGQKLMFPHISFTDYVPGEKQETIVRWDDE